MSVFSKENERIFKRKWTYCQKKMSVLSKENERIVKRKWAYCQKKMSVLSKENEQNKNEHIVKIKMSILSK